jgi:RNase P subunit RPR2
LEIEMGFRVQVKEWKYSTAHVYVGDGNTEREFQDGPKVVSVECEECGAKFDAPETTQEFRKGTFRRLPMAIYITCKGCDQHGAIPSAEISS